MSHLPDFVEEYGICGRASGESHESVHAMLARAKESMARMASTQQKYRTLFARATVNLTICGGGRINSKYKDRFVFVKTGKVPDSWVECFASTQVLSDAKMEVVKLSKH
mmetsp:Transcript_22812/g.40100  ORF Transcript_22812/g.40100 Transcript_22812/m.40100 type:complete len:109 (+) Transcript_22812:159-485(+)